MVRACVRAHVCVCVCVSHGEVLHMTYDITHHFVTYDVWYIVHNARRVTYAIMTYDMVRFGTM